MQEFLLTDEAGSYRSRPSLRQLCVWRDRRPSLAFLGGAIGVGIGFGLQSICSNFASGIIILVEKTLQVGDFVDLESGVRGTITEIAMRYTRVTTNDAVDVLMGFGDSSLDFEFFAWVGPTAIGRIPVENSYAFRGPYCNQLAIA